MKICVRGPMLTMSGYGNHARQVFKWAQSRADSVTAQVLPWGITPWYIDPDELSGLAGQIMVATTTPGDAFDISFQIQLPNEWEPGLAKFNVGVTAAVETDICNPEWVNACNNMDLVIVPSVHTRDTLLRTGQLLTPVVVVPESFPDEIIPNDVESFDLNVRTNFNFLIFGQLTGNDSAQDRKNTYQAIKWISEEFADDPNVGIIVKTNHGRNTTLDRSMVRQIFKQVVSSLDKHPPIYLLHGAMNETELAGLYRNETIAALVAPTRGEGFGLPLLEAAASALPVMATNWSGHCDFLNQGKWIKFDYLLTPVHDSKIDGQIFVKNSKWADVQEQDFKKKIRKFRNKPEQPKNWATDLRQSLLKSHTFDAIAKCWDSIMREYYK